jgi:hypothetical protein
MKFPPLAQFKENEGYLETEREIHSSPHLRDREQRYTYPPGSCTWGLPVVIPAMFGI